MKAVIKWTLWQRRVSTVWWCVGTFGLIFINMVFYPSFKDQADQLQKSFENLPDAAVQLFGGSTDFFSPVGFLNSQIFFLMLPLILGMLAIGLGSSLLAREEQNQTIESLLARPISRKVFLAAKALTGILILGMVTFVGLITTIVTGWIVDLSVSITAITQATFACFLLALSFGAVAFVLTATGRARSASLGIATTVALGGYLVSSLSGTVEWLRAPSYIFPFHYYKSEAILRGDMEVRYLLFFIAVLLVCWALSLLSFQRRDISN